MTVKRKAKSEVTYRVTSNRFSAPIGTILSASDLASVNIPALISAGHIEEISTESTTPIGDN